MLAHRRRRRHDEYRKKNEKEREIYKQAKEAKEVHMKIYGDPDDYGARSFECSYITQSGKVVKDPNCQVYYKYQSLVAASVDMYPDF